MLHVIRHDPGPVKFQCLVCGTPFFEGEGAAYERHVVRCADEHEDELRERSLRVRAPALFDPEQAGDVEFAKWVRANRKALWQGRLRM